MILTGRSIVAARARGDITLEPFAAEQVNPNSYNYRLGHNIKVPYVNTDGSVEFRVQEITIDGYVLTTHCLYLGATTEKIGSQRYAMSLIGRSSLGRLGLFLQVSANLGHTGSSHHWTLELVAAQPIRLYPGMIIGQVTFWNNEGAIPENSSYYARQDRPTEARDYAARLPPRLSGGDAG